MNEAQMIGVLNDYFQFKDFQIILLEEIIVRDQSTGKIIFYCAIYEKV